MAMKIDRTDIVGKTIYVMTEKHRYREVLPLLKEVEPKTSPIKDVNVEKKGYHCDRLQGSHKYRFNGKNYQGS